MRSWLKIKVEKGTWRSVVKTANDPPKDCTQEQAAAPTQAQAEESRTLHRFVSGLVIGQQLL
jgi:hypothetical protein